MVPAAGETGRQLFNGADYFWLRPKTIARKSAFTASGRLFQEATTWARSSGIWGGVFSRFARALKGEERRCVSLCGVGACATPPADSKSSLIHRLWACAKNRASRCPSSLARWRTVFRPNCVAGNFAEIEYLAGRPESVGRGQSYHHLPTSGGGRRRCKRTWNSYRATSATGKLRNRYLPAPVWPGG